MFYDILHDKYLRVLFGLGLALAVGDFIILGGWLDKDASSFIIHFTRDGVDVTGGRFHVYSIPAIGLMLICLNLFLANTLYRRERFLAYLFGFGSLGLSILLFIAVSVILSVN